MGHGLALKTLLLNIQFYVLVKTIDLYIHPSNSYNLVAKTLPVESCACVSCGAPVTRENDIRWKSFTFVIWRRPRARCCRCCRSTGPAPANSLFLLPAFWWHFSPSPKQCKHKKLLSVPPNLTTLHILVHFPAPAPCPECGWMSPCTVMTTIRGDVNASPHLDAAHSTNHDVDPSPSVSVPQCSALV